MMMPDVGNPCLQSHSDVHFTAPGNGAAFYFCVGDCKLAQDWLSREEGSPHPPSQLTLFDPMFYHRIKKERLCSVTNEKESHPCVKKATGPVGMHVSTYEWWEIQSVHSGRKSRKSRSWWLFTTEKRSKQPLLLSPYGQIIPVSLDPKASKCVCVCNRAPSVMDGSPETTG